MGRQSYVYAGNWGQEYGQPARLAPDPCPEGVSCGTFDPQTVPPVNFIKDPTGATFTSGGPVPRGHGPYLGPQPFGRIPLPLKNRGPGGSLNQPAGTLPSPLTFQWQQAPQTRQFGRNHSVSMSTMLMRRYQYVRANLPDKRPYNTRAMGVVIGMNSFINPALEFQRQDLRKKNQDDQWDTALDRAYEKLIRARERHR